MLHYVHQLFYFILCFLLRKLFTVGCLKIFYTIILIISVKVNQNFKFVAIEVPICQNMAIMHTLLINFGWTAPLKLNQSSSHTGGQK